MTSQSVRTSMGGVPLASLRNVRRLVMVDGGAAPDALAPFTLITDHVTIRPFRESDLALVEEASSDPFIPAITTVPATFTATEGIAFIERQVSRAATGYGWSMVIEAADRPVGQIGLWIGNAHHGRAELGYWIVESARGAGLAAAALSAVAEWAFDNIDVQRLTLFIEPWNAASTRTAERAGFTREALLRQWAIIDGVPRDMLTYARFRLR